jgi:hypothetical protein
MWLCFQKHLSQPRQVTAPKDIRDVVDEKKALDDPKEKTDEPFPSWIVAAMDDQACGNEKRRDAGGGCKVVRATTCGHAMPDHIDHRQHQAHVKDHTSS